VGCEARREIHDWWRSRVVGGGGMAVVGGQQGKLLREAARHNMGWLYTRGSAIN
jgi:hypothetical protein